MSSPYNSCPRPAEILINDGKTYLVRKAETFDDLLQHQKIPEHLKELVFLVYIKKKLFFM